MKSFFQRIISTILLFTLCIGAVLPASAAGQVTYNGDSKNFIFAPGSRHSPTDLFENFKNVMPGDKLTESIEINNKVSHGVKIELYMKSLGAQESTDDFLSKLYLTVKQNGNSEMFSAPANERAQLTDWVYLGTVYSGGVVTLDVTLEVPIDVGDEFQKEVGYIDWEFKINELPIEPDDPTPPATGDSGDIIRYAGIILLLLTTLMIINKKKRQLASEAIE